MNDFSIYFRTTDDVNEFPSNRMMNKRTKTVGMEKIVDAIFRELTPLNKNGCHENHPQTK